MLRLLRGGAALGGAALQLVGLAACSSPSGPKFQPEEFGSTTTHARNYASAPSATCEAARRALLSQGFVINAADAAQVKGRKHFQPEKEVHYEIEFTVVCAAEGGGRKSIAFVNALQDRYALKKSPNSASVGVSVIGSLSLPISSSDDSLVKVASETITAAPFYDRFFALLQRYLGADPGLSDAGAAPVPAVAPVPTQAYPVSGGASSAETGR
jgi:Uncharacterized protein conserved in bacteria (DUF2242)